MNAILKRVLVVVTLCALTSPTWAAIVIAPEPVAQWTDFSTLSAENATLSGTNGYTLTADMKSGDEDEAGCSTASNAITLGGGGLSIGLPDSAPKKMSVLLKVSALNSVTGITTTAAGVLVKTTYNGNNISLSWNGEQFRQCWNDLNGDTYGTYAYTAPTDGSITEVMFVTNGEGTNNSTDGTKTWVGGTRQIHTGGLRCTNYPISELRIGAADATGANALTGLVVHGVYLFAQDCTEYPTFTEVNEYTRDVSAGETWVVAEDSTEWGAAGTTAPVDGTQVTLNVTDAATLELNGSNAISQKKIIVNEATAGSTLALTGAQSLTAEQTALNASTDVTGATGTINLGTVTLAANKTLTVKDADAYAAITSDGSATVVQKSPKANSTIASSSSYTTILDAPAGEEDAAIEGITVTPNGGTIEVKGKYTTFATNTSATSTTVVFTDANATFSGNLGIEMANYTIGGASKVSVDHLVLSEDGNGRTATLLLKDTAELTVRSTDANQDTGSSAAPIYLGHWGGSSTLSLQDSAVLNAPQADILVGRTGYTQTLNLDGGTVKVKGIITSTNASGTNTVNLNGGALELGATGLHRYGTTSMTVNVNADTTLTATAATLPLYQPMDIDAGKTLSIVKGSEVTAVTAELTGAVSGEGKIDLAEGVTLTMNEGTATLSGNGSTVVKNGEGTATITLNTTSSPTTYTVNDGILQINSGHQGVNGCFSTAPSFTVATGAELIWNSNDLVGWARDNTVKVAEIAGELTLQKDANETLSGHLLLKDGGTITNEKPAGKFLLQKSAIIKVEAGAAATITGNSFSSNDGAPALEVGEGGTLTVTAPINRAVALKKTGTGTLVIGDEVSGNGALNIEAGVVQVTDNGSITGGAIYVGAGAVLEFTNTEAKTITNAITGGGTIKLSGTAPVTFSNLSGFVGNLEGTGALVLSGGTLDLAGKTYTNAITVQTGATVFVNDGDDVSQVTIDGGTVQAVVAKAEAFEASNIQWASERNPDQSGYSYFSFRFDDLQFDHSGALPERLMLTTLTFAARNTNQNNPEQIKICDSTNGTIIYGISTARSTETRAIKANTNRTFVTYTFATPVPIASNVTYRVYRAESSDNFGSSVFSTNSEATQNVINGSSHSPYLELTATGVCPVYELTLPNNEGATWDPPAWAAARVTVSGNQTITIAEDTALESLTVQGNGTLTVNTTSVPAIEIAEGGTLALNVTGEDVILTNPITGAGTLAIPEGVTVTIGNASVLGMGALSGTGTIRYTAYANLPTTAEASLFDGSTWAGTVYLYKAAACGNQLYPGVYGNANSTITFEGVAGWVASDTSIASTVKLVDETTLGYGLQLDNGDSGSSFAVTVNALAGDGTFKGPTQSNFGYLVQIKDVSAFEGTLNLCPDATTAATSNKARDFAVSIGESAATNADKGKLVIQAGETVTIPADKTWTVLKGIEANGELEIPTTADGKTIDFPITGSGTIRLSGEGAVTFSGDLKGFTGTIEGGAIVIPQDGTLNLGQATISDGVTIALATDATAGTLILATGEEGKATVATAITLKLALDAEQALNGYTPTVKPAGYVMLAADGTPSDADGTMDDSGVYTPLPLVWTPVNASTDWNTAGNWTRGGTALTELPSGKMMKFGNLSATEATVTLSANVTPATILVENSTTAYTIGSEETTAGAITGNIKITKRGTGALNLKGPNVRNSATRIGELIVEDGSVTVMNDYALVGSTANNSAPFGSKLTVLGGVLDLGAKRAWEVASSTDAFWLTQDTITMGGSAKAATIQNGLIVPYTGTNTPMEFLTYVGTYLDATGDEQKAPAATFAADLANVYTTDPRTRSITVGKGQGFAADSHDLEITGTLGLTGQYSGTTLVKQGEGTLKLSWDNNLPNLRIDAGKVIVGKDTALSASVEVAEGATLDLNGFHEEGVVFTGMGTITNSNTETAVTLAPAQVAAFAGTISGNVKAQVDLSKVLVGGVPYTFKVASAEANIALSGAISEGLSEYLEYDAATGIVKEKYRALDYQVAWMPMGDSITEGETDITQGGYRYALWNLWDGQQGKGTLAGENQQDLVTVGFRTGHEGTSDADETLDWVWHSGLYGGIIKAEYESGAQYFNVETALEHAGYPEILSLLIGINDLSQYYDTGSTTCEEHLFKAWSDLVGKMADARPYSKIVVSTIFPRSGSPAYEPDRQALNTMIRNAAKATADEEKGVFAKGNVILADIAEWAFGDVYAGNEGYFGDGLHPNAIGSTRVAQAFRLGFLKALNEIKNDALAIAQVHNGKAGKVFVRLNRKPDAEVASASLVLGEGTSAVTLTGGVASADDPRMIEFTVSAEVNLPFGTEVASLTLNEGDPIAAARKAGCPPVVEIYGSGAAANVPEAYREGFVRLKEYELAAESNAVPTALTDLQNISRVGYYMELKRAGKPAQFVWVSMSAAPFGNDARKVGLPAEVVKAKVSHLQVYGNRGNFENTGSADEDVEGIIEFTPYDWAATNEAGYPKEDEHSGNKVRFGWNDTLTGHTTPKGGMQVARIRTVDESLPTWLEPRAEMLFAYNNFACATTDDFGIGSFHVYRNNAGNTITPVYDWTNLASATGYTAYQPEAYSDARILEVWVEADASANTWQGGAEGAWSATGNWKSGTPAVDGIAYVTLTDNTTIDVDAETEALEVLNVQTSVTTGEKPVLTLKNATNLKAVTVHLADGVGLALEGEGEFTPTVTGKGTLVIAEDANLTLAASNTYTEGTIIESGAHLTLTARNALPASGDIIGSGTLTAQYAVTSNADALSNTAGLTASTWTGTVCFKCTDDNATYNLSNYGHAGSFIQFDGASGWIGSSNASAVASVELVNEGLTLNNGASGGNTNVTFAKLTGSGKLQGNNKFGYLITISDVSAFTGTLNCCSGTYGNASTKGITIGSTTPVKGKITIDADKEATIASGKTWTAPEFDVSGTLGGGGTVSGSLTLNNGATLDATAGTLAVTGTLSVGETLNIELPALVTTKGSDGLVVLNGPDGTNLTDVTYALTLNGEAFTGTAAWSNGDLVVVSDSLKVPAATTAVTGVVAAEALTESVVQEVLAKVKELNASASAPATPVTTITEVKVSGTPVTVGGETVTTTLATHSAAAAELFTEVVKVEPSATAGEATAMIAYDFGIERLTVREIGGVATIVLKAKVKGNNADADFATGTVVKVYKGADPVEGVEALDPTTIGEPAAGKGERWFKVPMKHAKSTGAHSFTIKAEKQ